MDIAVRAYDRSLLPQLQRLINLHLTAALPGWALSEASIARHLKRDDHEPITDPWVVERDTRCAVEGQRVLAAVHLLHYGDRPEVSVSYRGAGAIAWALGRPDRPEALSAVLEHAREQLATWQVTQEYGWDTGLPAGPLWGVPDAWPHVTDALIAAGYRPDSATHREAVYGGWLVGVSDPGTPPVPGLTIRRTVETFDTRFAVTADDELIGWCDVQSDLTDGGLSPILRGWGWITELQVKKSWRNRGIGRRLLQHAVAWLRLAGCDRVVLAVADGNERAGAGRFYRRFGWDVLVREVHGWVPAS